MIAILTGAGRQLLAHWPPIVAWFLAGVLVNWAVIQVAGWVGAYSALGGALLLPLAILARLVSYVAMFLVVRDGMRELGIIAPRPESADDRREQFLRALLGSILPFVAFYAAWGLLRDDMAFYYQRVLEVGVLRGEVGDGENGWLSFSIWTVLLIVIAFGLRWLLKRHAARLPRWFAFGAVYLELLWVFLTATLIGDGFAALGSWVDSRQAVVWVADARSWLSGQLVVIAWLWEAIEWFLGEAGGIILKPLAWLAIAGVVYGQAVAPRGVQVRGGFVDRARTRWTRVPGWLRSRLADVWGDLIGRFRPIGRVFVLMWRAGPILIGGYILLYTVLTALESLFGIGVTRVFGPNDFAGFWAVNDQLILLLIPLLIEPLRIVLVSSSYDQVIGRLLQRDADASAEALTTASDGAGSTHGTAASSRRSPSPAALNSSSTNGPDASEGTT
ncbi:hypothetical protein GCM10009775_15700 [Microbacterium aoyamense]|uniref:Uncharacterized protein n=1 Tax=Microbacterium aoyamense TaxID=344166 RepID=A0ABN2PKQ1_9MICO|nr:hypothetical protein [Microbacterium aoyamense]